MDPLHSTPLELYTFLHMKTLYFVLVAIIERVAIVPYFVEWQFAAVLAGKNQLTMWTDDRKKSFSCHVSTR